MRKIVCAVSFLVFSTTLSAQWTQPTSGTGPIYYNNGNVGIATSGPLTKLHIGGSNEMMRLGDGSGDLFVNVHTGFGVERMLLAQHINSNTQFTLGQSLSTHGAAVGVGVPAWIVGGNGLTFGVDGKTFFGSYYDATAGPDTGILVDYPSGTRKPMVIRGANAQSANLQEWQNSTGTALTAIDPAGKVTVGASGSDATTTMLTVNGSINVTGNINAKYQDVAEWVPATGPMTSGTVVVVDSEATNTVRPSAHAYDTGVAGVVSAQPGLLLGEAGAAKAIVATTGRVRVRVDASRGTVRAGDLLVTSDRPGVAMRSQPVDIGGVKIHRPGTLIGKALEPLDHGEGEILVLLSLQ